MNKDDRDILKKGDMVLIQVIIHKGKFGERIASECASFCFELHGKLCVYCNGSMLYIHEMHGATLTKLEKTKEHGAIIEKYTTNIKKGALHNCKNLKFIPWGFVRYHGELQKLTDEQNNRMYQNVKPWSVINNPYS